MLFSALLACPLLAGCAAKIKAAATSSIIKDVAAATARHDDLDLVEQAIPTYLLLLEGLLESNPGQPKILIALAEAYTSYGVLLEADQPERTRRIYRRARDYGLRALAGRKKKVAPLLEAPYEEFLAIHRYLKAEDVPFVFWVATSWGSWINTNIESMKALAQLPKVIYLMEWVVEEDESFLHGAPHVFLGVYHATLPPMLGGKPDESRRHFERALEISEGKMAMVYVQMARYYARRIFDRKLYESLLHQALAMAPGAIPELTLQNVAAQQMARKLLERTDEFF